MAKSPRSNARCGCFLSQPFRGGSNHRKSGATAAAEALEQAGVKQFIAVTNGSDGAAIRIPGQAEENLPALPAKAVDTTGAGDAFIAAVLAAWYRGRDWPTAARAESPLAL